LTATEDGHGRKPLDGPVAEGEAGSVSSDPSPNGDPVPVAIGSPRGRESAILIALLGLVVAAGAFGRLVPAPAPATGPGTSPGLRTPAPEPAVRLVSPIGNVLYLRSTEVLVRGVAQPGIRRLDARVNVGAESIGEAVIGVDPGRRFDAMVRITPPALRTIARLEIRELGGTELLAEVSFPIEAGALLLPEDPSGLHGRAGGVLVVDVFVYGQLGEVRGLLTGVDGHLFATGSAVLSGQGSSYGGVPRTVAIELKIPKIPLPARARLHLLGFDAAGVEVEHIDANVSLSQD
jgi:hypothetical protein